MRPFVESSDLLDDGTALRARAERDGYLFFRGLLDPARVRDLRARFVSILSRHAWLDPGTDPDALITTQPAKIEGMEEFWPVFNDFQRLEAFHALAHAGPILQMLARLFDEPVLVHPRNIGRIMFPTTPTTPPHQDYVHIQGTPDVWTAWVPLGDCPQVLGGLAVLSGSHRHGLLPVKRMAGAGGVGVDTDALGGEWVTADFNAGDVLFFHSQTVHVGLPNQTGNRMRLSVDYRYQGVSKPVTEGSLLPHFNRFSWDWVYEGWRSSEYQYYWRAFALDVVPFDRAAYRLVDEGKRDAAKSGY